MVVPALVAYVTVLEEGVKVPLTQSGYWASAEQEAEVPVPVKVKVSVSPV